jgi:hypothetical protein
MLAAGQTIGAARTFDVGLMDFRKPQNAFVNKKRYDVDFPALLAVLGWGVDPAATALAQIVAPQALYARCALDYFKAPVKATLTAKLSDHDGVLPRACRLVTAICGRRRAQAIGSTTRTRRTTRCSRRRHRWHRQLNVDPTVKLFSLNHNFEVRACVACAAAAARARQLDAPFSFRCARAGKRTGVRRDLDDQILLLRSGTQVSRRGRINGVILLRVSDRPGGSVRSDDRVAARGRCPALPTPWAFGGGAATFYR